MPSRNPSNDRQIKFVGARVLQADELNRAQELGAEADRNSLGSIYRDGGTLNVALTVNGSSITLSPKDPTKPMLVFLNGSFEPFDPVTLSYEPGKTTGNDYVYLNYALWRVTLDEAGTINDPTLADASTGEPISEIGQLQLSIEATDKSISTTGIAVDPATQFEKNMDPIVMFTLARGNGTSAPVMQAVNFDRVQPQALADDKNAGPVKLSTGTSEGVALAADDPRLVFGVPDNSVNTKKVVPLQAGTGNTRYGTPTVQVDDTHGIRADHVVHSSTAQSAEAAFTYLLNTLDSLNSTISSLTSRIAALEARPTTGGGGGGGTTGSYAPASHVGKPLGLSDSHPALVNSDSDGFKVVRNSSGAGSPTAHAYDLQDSAGASLFYVGHDGDIYSKAADAFQRDSTPLGKLSVLASKVAALTGGGGGGVAQSYVDTQDAATYTHALADSKTYTDQKVAGLGGSQASLVEATTDGGTGSGGAMFWRVITIGTVKLALGWGELHDGDTVQVPSGFSSGNLAALASPLHLREIANANIVECSVIGTQVNCYSQDLDGTRNPQWAGVQASCYFLG